MTSHSDAFRAAGAQPRSAVRKTGKKKRSANPFMGLSHLALALWALLVIVPILWTVLAAFKSNAEIFSDPWTLPNNWSFDNWTRAFEKAHIGRYMLNTVLVVGCSTFLTMLMGSMAAYVLARYTFPGNRFIYLMFVSGMTFPVFLALVPLFFVVKNTGMLGTYHGLILVYTAYSLPFTIFFLAAFFKTLPSSVAEAAAIDGCGHARTFFRIMLPMAKPGMISIAIFNVLGQWNQYLLPLVLMPSSSSDKWVITQGIASISTTSGYRADWGGLFAALSMAIIPVVIIYIIFQRQIQAGLTAGAVK
jgi:N-acetylglucosamine transport system permease protein